MCVQDFHTNLQLCPTTLTNWWWKKRPPSSAELFPTWIDPGVLDLNANDTAPPPHSLPVWNISPIPSRTDTLATLSHLYSLFYAHHFLSRHARLPLVLPGDRLSTGSDPKTRWQLVSNGTWTPNLHIWQAGDETEDVFLIPLQPKCGHKCTNTQPFSCKSFSTARVLSNLIIYFTATPNKSSMGQAWLSLCSRDDRRNTFMRTQIVIQAWPWELIMWSTASFSFLIHSLTSAAY